MTESPATSVPPLFSPLQIAVASLIAGPIPACWFFARNYRALGHPRSARNTILWGIVGMIALVVLSLFLPENFPRPAIPIGYTIGLYQTAHQIHGSIVREHQTAGGSLGSWPQLLGISFGILAALLALLLGATALLTPA